VQIQCQKDGGPLLVPSKYNDGCFGFNDKPPLLSASAGTGNIDCVIGFQSAHTSHTLSVFLSAVVRSIMH
jgi:hypothetical protein